MVIFGQVASRCPFFNVVHMRCGLFVLRLYWIERLRAHCVRDANVSFWTNNEILFGFGPWRTLSVDRTWHNTIKCLSIHFPVYYLLCHSSYARFAYQWNERTFHSLLHHTFQSVSNPPLNPFFPLAQLISNLNDSSSLCNQFGHLINIQVLYVEPYTSIDDLSQFSSIASLYFW